MSKQIAIIVGIESYRDPEIPAFEYADADARALAAAWSADEVELLLNDEATKTLIESRLRKAAKSREDDDQLTLIFIGHAFQLDGENYLACNDTLAEDLDLTSLPIDALFARAGIDLLLLDGSRFPLADPFLSDTLPGNAFTACAAGEVSYTAPLFGQGIWTHHLCEALQQPEALSGADLMAHLHATIPVTLRKTFSDDAIRSQTPQAIGDAEQCTLKAAGTGLTSTADRIPGSLTHVILSGEQAGKIKHLSGYNKQFHSLPEEINERSMALIEKLGAEEVETEAQRLFQAIKTAFKYKRREITCDVGEGCASIRTPDFDVDLNIVIDPDDLGGYLVQTAVGRFKTPAVVQSDTFGEVFSRAFNVLRFDFSRTFNIEDIIDTVEDLEDEAIHVAYPPDCSSCAITTTAFTGEILFDERGFRIQRDRGSEPAELLETFVAAQEMLGTETLSPASD